MKHKIIVIVGPTAVGKTAYSIELAKKVNGEIISGDSMQVYKHLNIGSAKVTEEEMDNVPHHLIDIREWNEDYSVSDFQKDASSKIEEIVAKEKVPIIVGGTGLYIESLLFDVSHSGESKPNESLRVELEEYAELYGNETLWEKLKAIDEKAAETIHPNNVRRVIRALEVYHETGQLFSSFQKEREKKEPRYQSYIVALNTERELLYERINERVDIMFEMGLEQETKTLWEALGPEPNHQSTKGIGYRELFPYFNQEISIKEATESIKQNSRRYAKRQLTWFRNRWEQVNWFDFILEPESKKESIDKILDFLKDE